jgi:UDP-N-acetylglucosamine/UDP-N-acetyl-alpha-D-glucosaminouronate 4-epimerase
MAKRTTPSARRRWLITGAGGFIGCNLARFLLERGEQVVGFDNFYSGKRANIDRLERRFGKEFAFHEGDIRDAAAVAAAVRDCTAVAHLAAQISVMRSVHEPEETHAINGTGFLNVYLAAARSGVSSFVYASSCAVYGNNAALPLSEDADLFPLSPYAASKLANEAYAAGMVAGAPQMTPVGLRFFNIFGAWQDAAGGYAAVIPKWIDLLMAGQPPVLYGDGSTTRDFCHIDNVCEAILRAAGKGAGTGPAVFNVGTGVATRLDTLYAMICQKLRDGGFNRPLPAVTREPARDGEVRQSVADTTKGAAGLGFRAMVDLEEGLCRLLGEQHGLSFTAMPRGKID